MKVVVVYNSETGFTKRYAEWLAEDIGCEAVALKEAKQKDFSSYDTMIFGSWCHAGFIRELKWFKNVMKSSPEKKYIVYAVGASPIDNPEIEPTLKMNITEEYSERCRVFYCPGGLNYAKMSFVHRIMMKMFAKMMAGKKDKTESEKVMAEMISKDYDISDRKYIQPIMESL